MASACMMQFGEIDIDSELVAFKESVEGDQAIMMLNNGCICCTVKEDLLVMLEELVPTLFPGSQRRIMCILFSTGRITHVMESYLFVPMSGRPSRQV